jgi:anti-sigma factor RsiW
MDLQCLDDASYVLGALTPAERRDFRRHLGHCSRCQASVRQLTQVQWLLTMTDASADETPGRS